MKRDSGSLVVVPALVLVLSVAVQAATPPRAARSEGLGYLPVRDLVSGARFEADRTPVIRAVEPGKGRPYRKEAMELVRRERFATLPDPLNGRELVDQIVKAQAGKPVMTSTDQAQAPRRAYQRERIGPGYVVPVCHGT